MFRCPTPGSGTSGSPTTATSYHLFFLYASRALHDPDARHYRASIGHAVSTDLSSWTRIEDALVRGDAPALRRPGDVDRFGGAAPRRHVVPVLHRVPPRPGRQERPAHRLRDLAGSRDLDQGPDEPGARGDAPLVRDARRRRWHDEAFRDPWVFADPDGDGWHMLITARARAGEPFDTRRGRPRGLGGPAATGSLRPPLTAPEPRGFGQLEVHAGRGGRRPAGPAVLLPGRARLGDRGRDRPARRHLGRPGRRPARAVRHRGRLSAHRRPLLRAAACSAAVRRPLGAVRVPPPRRVRRFVGGITDPMARGVGRQTLLSRSIEVA